MTKWTWIAVGLFAAVGVLVAAMIWFVPEGTDQVNEEFPQTPGGDGYSKLKSGTFQDGDSSHSVSGTVELWEDQNGFILRFENYEATSGPDVYFYLTEQANARSTSDVEGGMKLATPGGRDGGEATKRGNFNIPLPSDFDPSKWHGITVWCDDFNVVFGTAAIA